MWAVISTSKILKFFDFKRGDFITIDNVFYADNELGTTKILENHDQAVSTLLEHGIPLFNFKVDAKKEAVQRSLTGFKYLRLEPRVVARSLNLLT